MRQFLITAAGATVGTWMALGVAGAILWWRLAA